MNRFVTGCDPRGAVPLTVVAALLLGMCAPLAAAPADAYVVEPKRSRGAPEPATRGVARADWAFSVNAGLGAGGDLFQVKTDLLESWTAPVGGETFAAKRLTVTLDESLQLGLGLARRLTPRGWLRFQFSWTEMEATALAHAPFITLVPYDVMTMVRLGLLWEQRLLATPLSPYVCAGVDYLDVAAKADYLTQSVFAPTVGAGLIYEMAGPWRVTAELSDTIVQLESAGFTAQHWPVGAVYTERGPQHLISLSVGLLVLF
ncbi:hypothetical protein H8E07_04160 [bacterium]|nr:hypothetical protein [bacterium]